MKKNGIVTLSIGVPWKSILIPEPVFFVIYPSTRGGFNAQAVPKSIESNECKIYFLKVWRGQTDTLTEISGIPDLTFCHSSSYLIATKSIKAAVKACETATKNAHSNQCPERSFNLIIFVAKICVNSRYLDFTIGIISRYIYQ